MTEENVNNEIQPEEVNEVVENTVEETQPIEVAPVAEIVEEKIDVLLIAGDIFDTANPPSSAQQQFYKSYKNMDGLNIAAEQVLDLGQIKLNINYTSIKANQGIKVTDLK